VRDHNNENDLGGEGLRLKQGGPSKPRGNQTGSSKEGHFIELTLPKKRVQVGQGVGGNTNPGKGTNELGNEVKGRGIG